MRSSRIFTIACLLLTVFLFNNQIAVVHSSSTAEYSGLRTNRLILNPQNLTFATNDNFTVYLLVENIGQEIVYNLNFNYSVDKTLFAIQSSSNTTSTSDQYVYNNINKIEPGQRISFNMTLKVVSNTTKPGVLINAMTLNYQYSEFRLNGLATTPQLTINIKGTPTTTSLPTGVLGSYEIDSTVLTGLFALPIILAFILSFIFGRRRK